jgi:hypothetical protein
LCGIGIIAFRLSLLEIGLEVTSWILVDVNTEVSAGYCVNNEFNDEDFLIEDIRLLLIIEVIHQNDT